MDADASIPLPESAARKLSPFHRLMRSSRLGHVGLLLVALGLAVKPLVSVGPLLLLLAWLGLVKASSMQRFFDLATGWYMAVIMLCLEVFFGIRTRTFGHGEKFKQRSLFVMNHVCHFDWLFFWGVMERNGNIGTWKVVTKNSIKKVPFVGICMQYMCHIFISRRWELDEPEFRKKLFYYNALDLPVQLLLFPEGGDLTGRSKVKSDAYADTNGLKRYEYCLHPRARGFLYVVEALRSGRLDAVYDITVGYPDGLAKTEADFVGGKCIPREIHYNIRHYRAEDLPTNEEGLTRWLEERWREKEESLKLFYAHKRFVVQATGAGSGNRVDIDRNGHSEYSPIPEAPLPKSYPFTFFGLAFYLFISVLSSFLFYLHWVWRCCVLALTLYTFIKGLLGSGIDNVLPDRVRDKVDAAYRKCHSTAATTISQR